ncbi:MAG: hypothetical protein HYR67_04530 [Bacteroidetes bacterium]|nr:hypothetical protein [Bacteroidota bacterium]
MKKLLLFTVLSAMFLTSQAQNILTTPLSWSVTQLNDLNTNATMAYQCTFKTYGTQSMQWVQKKATTTLEVTSTSGTWTNVNANGKMVFKISAEGETGSLTFEKSAVGTYITIDLSQSGQTRLRQSYTVGSIVNGQ